MRAWNARSVRVVDELGAASTCESSAAGTTFHLELALDGVRA